MSHEGPLLLKREEWEYFKNQLRMTTGESLERRYSISSQDLLDEQRCAAFLDGLAPVLDSDSRKVTASLFAKRYAFLLICPSFYAMTMYGKSFDVSIGNCHVESNFVGESWRPNLRLDDWSMTQPADAGRQEWRDQIMKGIFVDHLAPIWASISKVARLPLSILWENTAIFVYALYEKRIADESSEEQKLRRQEDFDYLVRDAPADLFGWKNNPLAAYDSPKCSVEGYDKPLRIRKTCCLYYKASDDGSYCGTCPLVAASK
ncbi:IucA/IucC family C-terminal-domain containing protein [Paenibacillus mendelii]|uniref:IucA/IucC family C-terminal-domain containing protein n=1 Tax=Paenibacillus mendelii TaxID=206163 RepID=A0ABV6JFY8_9BACL|nr:IucA/IucC family C-terminal-domain containing protein [Paenibacillus mendelii]MCQ6561490.1 (2Fe-2S)-binding protein [Paenibacillus mendelii]